MKTWTLNVEKDPETGDLVVPIPQEIMEEIGWTTGDNLIWTDNKDGTWTVSKSDVESSENATK